MGIETSGAIRNEGRGSVGIGRGRERISSQQEKRRLRVPLENFSHGLFSTGLFGLEHQLAEAFPRSPGTPLLDPQEACLRVHLVLQVKANRTRAAQQLDGLQEPPEVSGGSAPDGNITLSNTFNPFLNINFTPIANQLSNNNFVRAELILTPDSTTMQSSLTSNQERTEDPPFRVQLGPSNDIAYNLGFNTTNSLGLIQEGVYKFDITGLFNAFLFGETDISEVYLYAGQNFGYLGFNTFFGFNAPENVVPKVLIYNLEETN